MGDGQKLRPPYSGHRQRPETSSSLLGALPAARNLVVRSPTVRLRRAPAATDRPTPPLRLETGGLPWSSPGVRRSIDLPSALEGRTGGPPGSAPLVLFLDYDGTLTPIVSRPEEARLAPEMRERVSSLAARMPVFVVSGRERTDVESLVGIAGIGYVGSHGFDIAGPPASGITHRVAVESLPDLDGAEEDLRRGTESIPGCLIERKHLGIAVHFRQVAPERIAEIDALVEATRSRYPRLRRAEGKKVFELRPDADWDKGRAVLWLLSKLGLEEHHPIHLGDDLTDESVFEAIADRGTGIFVGRLDRPTAASLRLDDPDQVGLYLDRLGADPP